MIRIWFTTILFSWKPEKTTLLIISIPGDICFVFIVLFFSCSSNNKHPENNCWKQHNKCALKVAQVKSISKYVPWIPYYIPISSAFVVWNNWLSLVIYLLSNKLLWNYMKKRKRLRKNGFWQTKQSKMQILDPTSFFQATSKLN